MPDQPDTTLGVQHVPAFLVRERPALRAERHEVLDPTGATLAFAERRRSWGAGATTVFHADEARTREAFRSEVRGRPNLGARHVVVAADGRPVGSFRKQAARSLVRTTFVLEAEGLAGAAQERSGFLALERRLSSDTPTRRIAVDVLDDDTGAPLLSVGRAPGERTTYAVDVPDPRVDVRLAAAFVVGLLGMIDH
ncbi:hypothetical protein QE370_002241 [Aeromicrobium sp. SORGH_AS981]|uniref:hypothetical protein n=1 Tax=Aeromicrobium sp. SORGH_AS_0981 TaxID=3041802 RepID=UPI00286273B3|nr:hypothetical protein [Aeromicrobium sp. SORGH_AS_0981]MDR6119057.1 hypothetical protein [Aeromicrobium sp. SORGH_AS_0981]